MPERPAARYIPINRNQQVLRPLDGDRLVDEDHAASNIWRVANGANGERTATANGDREWSRMVTGSCELIALRPLSVKISPLFAVLDTGVN